MSAVIFSFPACIKWAVICMHEGWKENILMENITPDLSPQIWVSYISDISEIFLFQDVCKGEPAEGRRKSGLRTFPVLPGCGPILYSAHSPRSGANHRQTYPIQSWLWRENLINIITNEMEREEKKGLFSPACWSRRVIGVKATERNRISLVANARKVRVRASSTPNKESFLCH